MSTPILITEAELRRASPSVSHWWAKVQHALRRDGTVSIACRDSEIAGAVRAKLWPDRYGAVRPRQRAKAAATIALREALRPRRTGKPRGRPRLYLDRVLAEIDACFNGEHFHDEARLRAIVLRHLGSMSIGQRAAVITNLDEIAARQGRRADWRRWLRTCRQSLKDAPPTLRKTDPE